MKKDITDRLIERAAAPGGDPEDTLYRDAVRMIEDMRAASLAMTVLVTKVVTDQRAEIKYKRRAYQRKYFIEIGYTERRLERRSLWQWVLGVERKYTIVTVVQDNVQKYCPGTSGLLREDIG